MSTSPDNDPFATEPCVPLCSASIALNEPVNFSLPDNETLSTVFVSSYGNSIIVYVPLSPADYMRQNSG